MILEGNVAKSNWHYNFRTKLTKVLQKMPLFVSVVVEIDHCFLKCNGQDFLYKFDFEQPLRKNVYEIREWLILNWCPKLINKLSAERPPLPSEIAEKLKLQKKDSSIDPFSTIIEETEKVLYIEKVFPKTGMVIVSEENIEGMKTSFKLNYPISKFMTEFHKLSIEDLTTLFFDNAEYLYSNKGKGPKYKV